MLGNRLTLPASTRKRARRPSGADSAAWLSGYVFAQVGLVPPPALQRESSSQQTGFVWQFESAEGWVSFGVEDQHRLEKALENGELNPLFGGRQFDLQAMTQTNVKTNKQRKLRRLPATASPHGRMPSARVDGETVEISVSTLRMHNGQFWLTGRLDLYPSKLVFTPDQSQVRSHSASMCAPRGSSCAAA